MEQRGRVQPALGTSTRVQKSCTRKCRLVVVLTTAQRCSRDFSTSPIRRCLRKNVYTSSCILNTSGMTAPTSIGFLLLDESLTPVFADPTVTSMFTELDSRRPTFDGGLTSFRSAITSLMTLGQLRTEFDFAGRRWRWSQFACNCCEGGPQTLNAFVLGPTIDQLPYTIAVASMFRLTTREAQALELFMEGFAVKEVAAKMEIKTSTAKTFLRSICGKMGVSNRSELMSRILDFSCTSSLNCPFRIAMSSPGLSQLQY
jgi:DNA-binding CsgD family transcriptional regulator